MSFFPRGQGPWLFWTPVSAITVVMAAERYVAPNRIPWLIVGVFVLSAAVALGMSAHAWMQSPRRELEVRTRREMYRRPVHSALWLRSEIWGAGYLALAVWMTGRI